MAGSKFDWNKMPIEGAAPAKGGGKFDWNSLPVETESDAPSGPGAGQAAIEGFGKGATFGYLPQIQAMTQPITDRVLNALPGPEAEPAPFSQMVPGSKAYIAARDSFNKSGQALAEQNPKSALAGNIAGMITTSIIPGGMVAKGAQVGKAGIGATALKGAVTGAVEAAAMNPGDVEGEFSPLQISDRIDNAKYGAAFGAAGGLAAGTIGKAVNKAKGMAEGVGLKSAGTMLKDLRAVDGKSGRANELGRFMLDRVLKAGDSVDDVARKTGEIKETAGKEIGRIYQGVMDEIKDPKTWDGLSREKQLELTLSGFKPRMQKADLMAVIQEKLGDSPNKKTAIRYAEEYLDDLATKYGDDVDVVRSNQIKGDIDGAINYGKRAQDLPEKEQALSVIRDHIRDQIEKHIGVLDDVLGGNNQVAALRAANKEYGIASQLHSISNDRMLRDRANQWLSLTDKIAGSAGAATGGISGALMGGDVESALKGAALGAGMGVGSRMARRYGPHVIAKGLDGLSKGKAIATVPAVLAGAAAKGIASPKFTPAEESDAPPILGDVPATDSKSTRAPARRNNSQNFADGGKVKTLGETIGYPGSGPAPKPDTKRESKRESYAHGGPIPGVAATSGDSEKNDRVPAMLSPGEIVLPRSVTMAKNAPEAAARFVAAQLNKSKSAPAKGFDKFAEQGAQKLGLDPDTAQRLMQSKEGKELLIKASDLNPGSKAMQRILDQIQGASQ